MSTLAPMVYDDITRIEVPVSIGKPPIKYILCEADGEDVAKWRNSNLRGAKFTEAGKIASVGDIAESDFVLLGLCLYRADDEGKLRLTSEGLPDKRYCVPIKTIKAWPSRISKDLFERAKEISQLNEPETKKGLEDKLLSLREKLSALEANGQDKESYGPNLPDSTTDGIPSLTN